MRNGEIDFMLGISAKEERKEYINFFEFSVGGGKRMEGGISKKSKFNSKRVNQKKTGLIQLINSVPTPKQWQVIFTTNYTSADQHDWSGK